MALYLVKHGENLTFIKAEALWWTDHASMEFHHLYV